MGCLFFLSYLFILKVPQSHFEIPDISLREAVYILTIKYLYKSNQTQILSGFSPQMNSLLLRIIYHLADIPLRSSTVWLCITGLFT